MLFDPVDDRESCLRSTTAPRDASQAGGSPNSADATRPTSAVNDRARVQIDRVHAGQPETFRQHLKRQLSISPATTSPATTPTAPIIKCSTSVSRTRSPRDAPREVRTA